MKSKIQKQKEIELGEKLLKESQNLIFVDFSGATVNDLKNLKNNLKKQKASFKVVKKRLLKIIFQRLGIDFDPTQFDAQVGTIFIPAEDITEAVSPVYRLFKEKEKQKTGFKILIGYDIKNKLILDEEKMKFIGQLPSREIVLGQFLGTIAAPIRAMLYILSERSKKTTS